MAKGSQFERDICRKLSLWWTHGERDDVFWRSAGSGAMATSRMRTKGKSTHGQHGDIHASDPVGEPLLKVCCFELKRGYGKWSPMDVVDAPPPRANAKKPVKQPVELFLEQAEEARDAAKATHAVVIARRDKRREVIMLPANLSSDLFIVDEDIRNATFPGKWVSLLMEGKEYMMCGLDEWLYWASPEAIVKLSRTGEGNG